MKPYIIVHMMTSIDGRIDCSMLEHLSADEYYVALEQIVGTADRRLGVARCPRGSSPDGGGSHRAGSIP